MRVGNKRGIKSDRTGARASALLLSAALTACASEGEVNSCGRVYCTYPQWIARSPLHSAYDGVHEYSLAPYIPSAASDSLDSDPVLAATVKWELDHFFVERAEFAYRPASIKLTTKRAGTTTIKFTAQTVSGDSVSGHTTLTISRAIANEWDAGDARFHAAVMGARTDAPVAPGEGTCGLDSTLTLQRMLPCAGCHDDAANTSAGYTPVHPEGYSDADLIQIVLTGSKPAGVAFESLALRDVPMPDCVFKEFHAWNLNESEMNGMIWKLRSIPPSTE